MELLPPRIRDSNLLALLGDLLGGDRDRVAAASLHIKEAGGNFRWQGLIELASQQDALHPLLQVLSNLALLPSARNAGQAAVADDITARLNRYYGEHLIRRELQKAQLDRVLGIFDRADVRPLILKGARYLIAPIGAWCEGRTLRDFDLLLRPDDAHKAFAALVAEGYRAGETYMPNYHHLPDLHRSGEPARVEIHTDGLAAIAQSVVPTEFLWRNARPGADGRSFVLPPKWQALHCLVHHQLSDHGFARRVLAVKPLWEWTMLTRDLPRYDWLDIMAHLQAAGALDLLGSWLVQSQALFGVPAPNFIAISAQARRNAVTTLALASAPQWRRRAGFVASQLGFAFSRETLAARFGKTPSGVSVADGARYFVQLLRTHRGGLLRRLLGNGDRLS